MPSYDRHARSVWEVICHRSIRSTNFGEKVGVYWEVRSRTALRPLRPLPDTMPRLSLPSLVCLLLAFPWPTAASATPIPRYDIVSRYNPVRNASSTSTPMQVGNGFFAFGADVTGLQTFQPWAIMSDRGWKNDSLPAGVTEEDILTYRGVVWDGVQYEFGGPAAPQQWLISNPNRANLGRVGLLFIGAQGEIANFTEADISDARQQLDLWTGKIKSNFTVQGQSVSVETSAAQSSSAVAFTVKSDLLSEGRLGLFLDFPWNDGSQKFQAPFVGYWNVTGNHTTQLHVGSGLGANVQAQINHTEVAATVFASVGGGSPFTISRDSPAAHRYSVVPSSPSSSFSIVISYSLAASAGIPTSAEVTEESMTTWTKFWLSNGFIDVYTGSTDPRADELQRRIVLSRYLMRVNEAGYTPPQEVSPSPHTLRSWILTGRSQA